jgi:hypothetical protein
MENKIYCNICKKYINLHEDTRPIKNEQWDLICQICGNWLIGMKDALGWEIDLNIGMN